MHDHALGADLHGPPEVVRHGGHRSLVRRRGRRAQVHQVGRVDNDPAPGRLVGARNAASTTGSPAEAAQPRGFPTKTWTVSAPIASAVASAPFTRPPPTWTWVPTGLRKPAQAGAADGGGGTRRTYEQPGEPGLRGRSTTLPPAVAVLHERACASAASVSGKVRATTTCSRPWSARAVSTSAAPVPDLGAGVGARSVAEQLDAGLAGAAERGDGGDPVLVGAPARARRRRPRRCRPCRARRRPRRARRRGPGRPAPRRTPPARCRSRAAGRGGAAAAVPITVAPRPTASCAAVRPTPPATPCTRTVSPVVTAGGLEQVVGGDAGQQRPAASSKRQARGLGEHRARRHGERGGVAAVDRVADHLVADRDRAGGPVASAPTAVTTPGRPRCPAGSAARTRRRPSCR